MTVLIKMPRKAIKVVGGSLCQEKTGDQDDRGDALMHEKRQGLVRVCQRHQCSFCRKSLLMSTNK